MKKKVKRHTTETVTVSVPVGFKEVLKKAADKENRTVTSYIKNALQVYFKDHPPTPYADHVNGIIESERQQISANRSKASQ